MAYRALYCSTSPNLFCTFLCIKYRQRFRHATTGGHTNAQSNVFCERSEALTRSLKCYPSLSPNPPKGPQPVSGWGGETQGISDQLGPLVFKARFSAVLALSSKFCISEQRLGKISIGLWRVQVNVMGRGQWVEVVGRGCGSWVWVNVVGKKKKKVFKKK